MGGTGYKWLFPRKLSDDDLFSPLAAYLTFIFISHYKNIVPVNNVYYPKPTQRQLCC